MILSKDDLGAQLVEFRKASRLIMWYYDCANKLFELVNEALVAMKQFKDIATDETEIEESCDRPEKVSFEAYEAITGASNCWNISSCSEKDFKTKRNSFCLDVSLYLDYWPMNSPKESLSAVEVFAYRVTSINGRATDKYDDLDDDFDEKLIREDSGIDVDGNILEPMKLTAFPGLWSSNNKKYKGDYAAGLYNLADLVDEDAVLNTVIADIKKLVEEWS